MKRTRTFHTIDTLFTFLLLLAFLLFSLLLAQTGSVIYKKGAASLDQNYTTRTALSYISEKIRQHDSADAVSLTELESISALTLREQYGDETFLTYIYCYDGALRELFTRASTKATLEMGSPIAEIADCTFEEVSPESGSEPLSLEPLSSQPGFASNRKILKVEVTGTDGATESMLIHPSSSR